ncbi:hypothetical protein MES5069_1160020 [Mesorhizobium escarrei]|uniref:Histidine kinase/HSP90-like ATPase domain-containing protein n=1 Tax=Mesorhizobium escarrei TaxID=666018 RepID=A0ABM9DGJ9_9HYPH|nr:hypothetical protein MES5069_1160020 [Mesorhizobium escarrei]
MLGNCVQLQQVIINLLLNEADAIASVDGRPRELAIRSQRPFPGQVLIAVRGTGIDIDPQASGGSSTRSVAPGRVEWAWGC